MTMPAGSIDEICVNTIRTLCIDAVQQANSGHPGTPMAMAPVVYTLWQDFLRFDPDDPIWPNRDRFVLVGGARLDPALRDAAPDRRHGGRRAIRAARHALGIARRPRSISASSAASAPVIPNIT